MSVNSTLITVVGRVVTDIETRVIPNGTKVANFRLMTQERVYDKENGLWADGDRMYLRVACWRKLADNVAESLRRGDQVLVSGRLKVRKYDTESGAHREDLEVDAKAVGPDLTLHTVQVNRLDRTVSPHQQKLVDPPPARLLQEEPGEAGLDEPLTQPEVVQAA
ncbi:single-stranded DNA-binding protein [Actinophytocola sp.]|uniref:single-stranded DNA-binding protein n=1 Tax=Actinophytocola sp. TaxID=1872138 RepID=UPI00389AC386